MANPFVPKSSHPTFEKVVDQFLKKVTLTDFGSLDERDQYNAHRLKTIANSIYARGRGEHAVIYEPWSSRYMAEVEGMGSQRFYNICKYLESLKFRGSYKEVFSDWIRQLKSWYSGYEQMERGEHKLQEWVPEEMKRQDIEEKRGKKELVGKCIGQLETASSRPNILRKNPYVFYGHELYGGIIMSKELFGPFVIRFFFDTMLNKDYWSSTGIDKVIKKRADEFVVGSSEHGVSVERVIEPESKVYPYVVMYQGLEFEPYVPLNPKTLLALCDENGVKYQTLELGEGKYFSWPEHKFHKDAEEMYEGDPEVQRMKEEMLKSY